MRKCPVLGIVLSGDRCDSRYVTEVGGGMRKDGVCCVDLGTSHIKAGLIDPNGHTYAFAERFAPPLAATDGSVTFDADAYVAVTWATIHDVLIQQAAQHAIIAGVAITNQRATLVPINADGRAGGPAISWQDTQGGAPLDRFIHAFGKRQFISITGLPPSALWTVAKLLWLQDTRPAWFHGCTRFVLLHDYLLARLGAVEYYTDPSNASLTGLFDLRTRTWSDDILTTINLPASYLSVLQPAGAVVGAVSQEATDATGLPVGTPLLVGGGDQQCGALGIGASQPGDAGIILGTAAVISCPMDHPVFDETGRFFCTAHIAPNRWVIEGIHNTFGSAIRWMSQHIGIEAPEAFDALARHAPPGAHGIMFYPYLAGIGSPDFESRTRGALLGIGLETQRADLARAVLEGTTMELRRILETITPRVDIQQYIVAGGGATRPLRVQLLADLLGHAVAVNPVAEATLLGVAICAWTGLGRFATMEEGLRCCTDVRGRTVEPHLSEDVRQHLWARYQQGVSLVRQFHGLEGGG